MVGDITIPISNNLSVKPGTSANSVPTGALSSHWLVLILDSKHDGADLDQIQDVLRPTGALLIGAYRPAGMDQ